MPDRAALKTYYDRKQWFEGGEPGGYQDYERQTAWSVVAIRPLLEVHSEKAAKSILDVGCGYGAHLELAADLGWKCFGVELSDHAREIAKQRLGGRAYIVEKVTDLIPHAFDVVLMLDVIEHLPEPYTFFYSLFSIGAITSKTRLLITTPNAGSSEALQNPATWVYRHPPSHLIYYRAKTLQSLLHRLHFDDINVRGVHPLYAGNANDLTLADYGGLFVEATGSDFTEFMRERYVPGTWSKIAGYEHLPRYEFAKKFVKGKNVLDFGCGTGYGSAILSSKAISVLGLDISSAALAWARETHYCPRLSFCQSDDLGAALPAASFDLITCFEMIEHVSHDTQQAAVASFSRLLREDGLLIISTPNPEVTKLYGANPYHLREMTLPEFRDLLGEHFLHIQIFEQRVRDSITFDPVGNRHRLLQNLKPAQDGMEIVPLAYIAVCSNKSLNEAEASVFFGEEFNPIQDLLDHQNSLNKIRFEAYQCAEMTGNLHAEVANRDNLLAEAKTQLASLRAEFHAEIANRDNLLAEAATQQLQLRAELQSISCELRALRQTRWFRLREVLLFHPFGVPKLIHLGRIIAGGIMPRALRQYVASRQAREPGPVCMQASSSNDSCAYRVNLPSVPPSNAPRIVHVIANFMTGGSSRLVIDLVENLGGLYQQYVLTSFNPSPPAYVGLHIEECRFPESLDPFVEFYKKVRPAFVHVHYWGDCDESWYAKAIEAAEMLSLPVIENINTPIDPFRSQAVAKYVYVSDYVRSVFGDAGAHHVTVYPGSDFNLFTRVRHEHAPEDCVGMVYRLERDKLNEDSIKPFIRIAQLRPRTKILIVGGGSLYEPFKAAVQAAGVAENFEFTGYVSYDALPDLYSRMSLFVAPVWKESFGQVSPFAMSMKVPVIGYDVGAIKEIIGTSELVAPAGDAEALAHIAVRLLDAPQESQAIGEAQQQRAHALFSVQAMIDQYAQIYAEVILKARKDSL